MLSKIKDIIIGKPLKTSAMKHEKFSVLYGLAILASDAISSVAYATEEILWVLIPVIGLMAYRKLFDISIAIILLLALLVFSYRQTIKAYPNGGGAYTVAKENLGVLPGLIAGSSLSVDYILTVAVSISAGTAAITSAFPTLSMHRIAIALGLIVLLTIVNLRGVKESARIFSIPTYLFVFSMLTLIIVGIVKYKLYGVPVPTISEDGIAVSGSVTIFLLLRAFSSGCAALTGVEAVSNSVPNFKEPSTKKANTVLSLLAVLVLIIFGGISILATVYHAVPIEHGPTVVSQITSAVFGKGFMYYFIQITTALILVMASNTAFSGFPMLMSVVAYDGYAPRQLKQRGGRLSYSNGIVILAIFAGVLIIIFRGDTHLLIPLYAVGVFISFTLSQIGMTLRWIRSKDKGWRHKALINGLGGTITAVTAIIIGVTKFIHGAWVVVLLIPIIVKIMLSIKRHYEIVANNLRITPEHLAKVNINQHFEHHIIVPMASLNRAVIETLKYARSLSNDVIVLHVATDEIGAKKVEERWNQWNPGIPLIIKKSPYRYTIEPLIEYIDEFAKTKYRKNKVTVLIPQFIALHNWENYFLHNQTSFAIRQALLVKHKDVIVSSYPYYVGEKD